MQMTHLEKKNHRVGVLNGQFKSLLGKGPSLSASGICLLQLELVTLTSRSS